MKSETERAISELIQRGLFHGGGTIGSGYQVVDSEREAVEMASSAAWEEFCVRAYNGIVIRTLQGRVSGGRGGLEVFFEELPRVLAPLSRQLQRSKWNAITRFPFELILLACFAEIEFSDVLAPVFFAPMIYPVLQAGHYPCGWDGNPLANNFAPTSDADFSEGTLCVHPCAGPYGNRGSQ
jgi:hypothetical protein